jgi:transposase InsO family protein
MGYTSAYKAPMSWNPKNTMSLRLELVTQARAGGVPFAELCRRFGVSRKTGYKWLRRHDEGGESALADRSRRPLSSAGRTPSRIEKAVVAARRLKPVWGPRKLIHVLEQKGVDAPAPSTVAAIIRRNGLENPRDSGVTSGAFVRFEHDAPNDLWQMDFKGHVAMGASRLHPLTMVDDHSRYLVGLFACGRENDATVRAHLTRAFRLHGLPRCILCDHGSPWGSPEGETALGVWLMRLGVRVTHGRVRHPQTQGKCERFHRTLKAELLARRDWHDLGTSQRRFDDYRQEYNHRRPHEALGYKPPASRYRPSPRAFPEKLPEPEYLAGDLIKRVKGKGEIMVENRTWVVGRAFAGEPVALRPQGDGLHAVYYSHQRLGYIDLRIGDNLPKNNYRKLLKKEETDL